MRGTLEGLRRQLLLYLGWISRKKISTPCACRREAPLLILEHFKLRRWLFLGEARLGDQSVLWGKRIVNRTQLNETAQVGATQLIGTPDPVRDPFHVYAHKFSVFVPASCVQSDDRRASIERLISLAKPAHTAHQLELVHPRFRDRFPIGDRSRLGRGPDIPQSFTLGSTAARVLTPCSDIQLEEKARPICKSARDHASARPLSWTDAFAFKKEDTKCLTKHQTRRIVPIAPSATFTRNHYFTGKLLVERDFTDEQRFHIDKLRHHHQRLHGWGVVCGLKVKQHPNPAAQADCLIIEPGTAIDCCGHEILVRTEVPFHFSDAAQLKALRTKEPPDTGAHTLQICIRYKECGTEEIPVLFDECGCDETRCAPNRILESYELDVLVDPTLTSIDPEDVSLEWTNTTPLAHSIGLALHDATQRLYVMSSDTPAVIHAVSTANHTIVDSVNLPAKGLALAVSNDGNQLYVGIERYSSAGADALIQVTSPRHQLHCR